MQMQMGRRVILHRIKPGGPQLLQLLKGLGEIVKKLFLILGVDIDILPEPRILYQHNVAEVAQTVMIGSLAHRGATAASFTPNFKNYMAYQGSVTAPPCTEGVQWLLLRNPVYIYGEDYAALHSLLGDNFRPVQPLDGRVVSSSV